jgi:hypothetical protein
MDDRIVHTEGPHRKPFKTSDDMFSMAASRPFT